MASFVCLDPALTEAQLLEILVTEANTFTFSVKSVGNGVSVLELKVSLFFLAPGRTSFIHLRKIANTQYCEPSNNTLLLVLAVSPRVQYSVRD